MDKRLWYRDEEPIFLFSLCQNDSCKISTSKKHRNSCLGPLVVSYAYSYFQTTLPVIFGHTPAGSSVRQIFHYAQGISGKGFNRYDQGSSLANNITYGSTSPPSYDLSKVTAPVFLHYSANDLLSEIPDVDTLFEQLSSNTVSRFLIPMSSFSHFDFLYAIDAKELVYDNVINLIKAEMPMHEHRRF